MLIPMTARTKKKMSDKECFYNSKKAGTADNDGKKIRLSHKQ